MDYRFLTVPESAIRLPKPKGGLAGFLWYWGTVFDWMRLPVDEESSLTAATGVVGALVGAGLSGAVGALVPSGL